MDELIGPDFPFIEVADDFPPPTTKSKANLTVDSTNIPHTTYIALTILLIFIGNILMIVVIVTTKALRNPHGYLLLSVAIADLIVGIETILGFITIVTQKWPTDPQSCIIIGYITALSITVTMYTLAAMSVERWISVHKPLHYFNIVTRKKTLVLIALIWVISFLIYTPYFKGHYKFAFIPDAYVCMIDLYSSSVIAIGLTTITTIPSLVIILICSLWIFKTAHRHAKQIQTGTEVNLGNIFNRHVLKMNKHIKTTLLITIAFCVTWLPYYFFQIYIAAVPTHIQNEYTKRTFFVVKWALISNSYINWVICMATDRLFRDSTFKLFSKIYNKMKCCPSSSEGRRDSQNNIYMSEAHHI